MCAGSRVLFVRRRRERACRRFMKAMSNTVQCLKPYAEATSRAMLP